MRSTPVALPNTSRMARSLTSNVFGSPRMDAVKKLESSKSFASTTASPSTMRRQRSKSPPTTRSRFTSK